MAPKLIWYVLFIIAQSSAQYITESVICQNMQSYRNTTEALIQLQRCTVVLGNLRIALLESKEYDLRNVSFPKLREVTGTLAIYRVLGLDSVGRLFPNLVRIRGRELINNFALIIHDMPGLVEVGLYNLLKIDRGGVVIWGGAHTCYVRTIDWSAIAPNSQHMLNAPAGPLQACHTNECFCGHGKKNFCWNKQNCQRFLEGPASELCHEQCLGCEHGSPNKCDVCRHYTYRRHCLANCPDNTIILPASQYCITNDECNKLRGWAWNKTCVFDCPAGLKRTDEKGLTKCEPCDHCNKVCPTTILDSLRSIQFADKCVYINGSLIIHVKSIPGVYEELKTYLKYVEEVSDYILIYSSTNLTSLNFLPSLKRIKGHTLRSNKYSLVIKNLNTLRKLFTPEVTKRLRIDRGKLQAYDNPVLCMNEIEEIRHSFPVESTPLDIPIGMNGYSGGCAELGVNFTVEVLSESIAHVKFNSDTYLKYTVLYAKLPFNIKKEIVPEKCSKLEWQVVQVPPVVKFQTQSIIISSLYPASKYRICIETNDANQTRLGRSSMVDFNTPPSKPEPSLISSLVTTTPNKAVLRWIDHKDFKSFIDRYELNVMLIEARDSYLTFQDHCNDVAFQWNDPEYHSLAWKVPLDYDVGCDLICDNSEDIEDHFDVCSSLNIDCVDYEPTLTNSSIGKYIRTLNINISITNEFQVDDLAPYTKYKFRLRACAKDKCSRSSSGEIRTLREEMADMPTNTNIMIGSGQILIKWEPPDITNGPILAYFIQTFSTESNTTDFSCVSSNESTHSISVEDPKNYSVRVCATTLATFRACSDWVEIPHEYYFSFNIIILSGFLISFLLLGISFLVSYVLSKREQRDDSAPLVNLTSMYRIETDPPMSLRDFMPSYSVPVNDTHFA